MEHQTFLFNNPLIFYRTRDLATRLVICSIALSASPKKEVPKEGKISHFVIQRLCKIENVYLLLGLPVRSYSDAVTACL